MAWLGQRGRREDRDPGLLQGPTIGAWRMALRLRDSQGERKARRRRFAPVALLYREAIRSISSGAARC